MIGTQLRFYTYENRRHGGALLHDWLLDQARQLGIGGGSAFRAIAGFGHHGQMHEQHFFELAGAVPVLVEFIVDDAQADALIDAIERADVALFYARTPTRFGQTGAT